MTHEHFFREVPGRGYTTLSGMKVIVKRCYCGEEIAEKVEEQESRDDSKFNKLTQKRLILKANGKENLWFLNCMKIKISKLDQLFSEFIRKRARGKCEYCKLRKDWKELQCSHFWGRRNQGTRYDPNNVAGLCFACHQYLGSNPEIHRLFFMNRLGEKNYQSLMINANTPTKIDEKAIEIVLRAELKKYV